MNKYNRITAEKVNGTIERYVRIDKDYICSAYDIITEEKHEVVDMLLNKLAEFEDKLEASTLVELPRKRYQVVYVLGWEILEYDIVKIKYSHTEGIISVEATRPHTVEYFTKDTRYEGRVIGVDVFFSEAEAKAVQKSKN